MLPSSSSGSMQSAKSSATSSSLNLSPEGDESYKYMEGGWVVVVELTESLQTVFQLSHKHGAVFFFVVQLETFQEILVAALVLLGFDLLTG